MLIKRPADIRSSEITDKKLYLNRREFIQAMKDRAAFYGLTASKIEPVVERGDVAMIGGRRIKLLLARPATRP